MASTSTPIRAKPKAAAEFRVEIRLAVVAGVADEIVEELTLCVEEALNEHAAEIAPGASASANFADRRIEIDCTMVAQSPEKLHERVGEVVRIALTSVAQYEEDEKSVSFASSATASVLAFA